MTQTIHRSDNELHTNVTDELLYNPSIDAARLSVSTNSGVVTLSGEVDSLPERHAAKRSALRVWGVKAVTDDMVVVRDPGMSGAKDTDIAEAAKQMLNWAVDVPSDSVKADVRNHTLTLSGTVKWQYQREAAARAVMYLKGVTAVTNSISLTTTAPASEAKAAIEAAILRNAQLDSGKIIVNVNGGEVTLNGSVQSWAERRQAGYVAWAASGVTSVKNHLAITS
ncbi:BON domain-containing protein [Phytohabitans rumicis]|uniref:Ornithine aminotransferase n=1 Tax=Phytohabitans rumicis TaxID=1076125 RepID=A0A6V8KSV3_9ACTN|nr:BON domain-containing protein [Phytohabitans rumicis]GFJ88222.1 ornithine aminotransferase [Phytohabitans rumicis]